MTINYQKKVLNTFVNRRTFIDFAFRTDKKYHPQVFLEEGINIVKERKMPKYGIEVKEISLTSKRFWWRKSFLNSNQALLLRIDSTESDK